MNPTALARHVAAWLLFLSAAQVLPAEPEAGLLGRADFTAGELTQLERLTAPRRLSRGEEFGRFLAELRRAHVERASRALDYEVVKLFRNPIRPGNCFYDFLLRQAAEQAAVTPSERLAFLTQARRALDADAYRLRFQGTWRAITGTGCGEDARGAIWRRYLAAQGVDRKDPRQVMELIETTAAAFDRQDRAEQERLRREADGNRLGFRDDSGLFVTSIFDTAFRVDRLAVRARQDRAQTWRRVLVAGPGLNVVDPFLGTQAPVSSPQPVCLLESLLAHGLADARTRIDLVDLNPEVLTYWKQASRGIADAGILGYLLAGEAHGEAGRLTHAYLQQFGRRVTGRASGWFANREARQEIVWVDASGQFVPRPPGVEVRELAARAEALVRFSPSFADLVTDRIAEAGTYDLAVATNLLLYFEPHQAALAVFNLGRLLREGGFLFVTENLDAVLPEGHPLRRVWTDRMEEAVPAGVTLPAFYLYRKRTPVRP